MQKLGSCPDLRRASFLEDLIRQVFILVLTGCSPPSDNSWLPYALPAHWSIFVSTSDCAGEMAASYCVTEPLVQCILDHSLSFTDAIAAQRSSKASLRKTKRDKYSNHFSELYQQLDSPLKCAMDLASVWGASSWLTTLPLNEHGFALHKSAFLKMC